MEWWPSTDEPNDEPSTLINEDQRRHGVPLWEEENTILVDGRTGVVSRADGEGGPGDVIAASLGEFLTHFVAAGCFSYGAAERARFERYWNLVKHLVPFDIAPKDNRWLQHLDRWYRGDITTHAE